MNKAIAVITPVVVGAILALSSAGIKNRTGPLEADMDVKAEAFMEADVPEGMQSSTDKIGYDNEQSLSAADVRSEGDLQFPGDSYYVRFMGGGVKVNNGPEKSVYALPPCHEVVKVSMDTGRENVIYRSHEQDSQVGVIQNNRGVIIIEVKKGEKGLEVLVTDTADFEAQRFEIVGEGLDLENCRGSMDAKGNLYLVLRNRNGYVHDELYRIDMTCGGVFPVWTAPRIGSIVSDGENIYLSYAGVLYDGESFSLKSSFVAAIDSSGNVLKELAIETAPLTADDAFMKNWYESARAAGCVIANEVVELTCVDGNDLVLEIPMENPVRYFVSLPYERKVRLDKETLSLVEEGNV